LCSTPTSRCRPNAGRFYDATARVSPTSLTASRLLYPMEGEAMRFLNHLGNVFFAKALSFALGNPLSTRFCARSLSHATTTRASSLRRDFRRLRPVRDYELLFPASIFALGIVEWPIRLPRANLMARRTSTAFHHCWMLLKMTSQAFSVSGLGTMALLGGNESSPARRAVRIDVPDVDDARLDRALRRL